jgi:glutamate 5-kinase
MESRKVTTRRLVVKVGSQVLCNSAGELNVPVLASLADQIHELGKRGWQTVLVSSGAVAAGTGVMNAEPGARKLQKIANPVTRKQALAATGQVRLMETWRQQFISLDVTVAQVLASRGDFQTRRHYLNMRACIESLLECGVVPIVNENDVVAVTELMFTDNDELAGLLAGMINADLLCLLSSVAGVYDGNANEPDAVCIHHWDEQIHQLEEIVQRGTSALGRGGMNNKIATALKASRLGSDVVIADGRVSGILLEIIDGAETGTRFAAQGEASSAKRWLASANPATSGSVTINEGAEAALLDRNRLTSLLPVGVESVDGTFESGEVIQIRSMGGRVLGCGRTRYDHKEIAQLLGERGHKPLIHYDYLYLADVI